MGLDQYLDYRVFLDTSDGQKAQRIMDVLGLDARHYLSDEIWRIELVVPVGYWRKVNSVHAWFVDKVQGGRDECQTSELGIDELRQLRRAIDEVLADHDLAKEMLPTRGGFFFGTTEYDQCYFEDLEDTLKIIARAERINALLEGYFSYRASW